MKKRLSWLMVLVLFVALCFTGCMSTNTNTDKKAMLVVSFGSSFIENREAALDAVENDLKENFADYDFYKAFTSQIIIDIYEGRDGVDIYNVEEAIEEIYKGKYGEVLVVPTLVINGEEYDEMMEAIRPFEDKFEKLIISSPLLTTYDDYVNVVNVLKEDMPETNEKEAVVLMGHGTPHHANSAYGTLDYIFKDEGCEHVYVGTVEGFPTFDTVLGQIKEKGYEKVTLMPAMMVAGDHAHNDMAGDEGDSWKNLFKSEGLDVEYVMKGLGEFESIREQIIMHAENAIAEY